MKTLSTPSSTSLRLILTATLMAAATAHAASGYSVAPAQERLVSAGMDASTVEQTLGRPAIKHSYANEPGPTWTYRLQGSEQMLFDVDFDADGKVLSVSERTDETGRTRGGRL